MATFAPVLVLMMLSIMSSTAYNDEFGFGRCPDFKEQADETVSYDLLDIPALIARIGTGGPYKVILGAESDEASDFSCITITPGAFQFEIEYYYEGVKETTSIPWSVADVQLKGTLPKGLLNSPNDRDEVTFTVVSDKDGLLVLKTCKGSWFKHWTSTYILADTQMIDVENLYDMDCLKPAIEEEYDIGTWPKGVCVA